MDRWFTLGVGLGVIALAVFFLVKLWKDRKDRPGLVLVVAVMVAVGGAWVWHGLTRILGQ